MRHASATFSCHRNALPRDRTMRSPFSSRQRFLISTVEFWAPTCASANRRLVIVRSVLSGSQNGLRHVHSPSPDTKRAKRAVSWITICPRLASTPHAPSRLSSREKVQGVIDRRAAMSCCSSGSSKRQVPSSPRHIPTGRRRRPGGRRETASSCAEEHSTPGQSSTRGSQGKRCASRQKPARGPHSRPPRPRPSSLLPE